MQHKLTFSKTSTDSPNPNTRAERIFSELLSDGYRIRDVLNLSSKLLSLAMVELKKS